MAAFVRRPRGVIAGRCLDAEPADEYVGAERPDGRCGPCQRDPAARIGRAGDPISITCSSVSSVDEAAELRDWLSRLLELMPVSGALDVRCSLGAPWRIVFAPYEPGEIAYHVVLDGTAILEEPVGRPASKLTAGDILVLPYGSAHAMHDGSGAAPVPARNRRTLNVVVHENAGTGERLDMMCGRFVLSPAHQRLVRSYLPHRLIVRAAENAAAGPGTAAEVAALVGLMRTESASENLGGLAMLNAFSAALLAFVLRLASESRDAPEGLLALAGNPRLAPALTAIFNEPGRPWTLPELARRCNMSRATFIRHFRERLGRSACELLTDIRMTVAANALKGSEMSTATVAELAGYQSESAFQRAFRQRMGVTPARWRSNNRAC